MNYRDYLVARLKRYSRDQIIISEHALIRIKQRQLRVEDIMENILNPKRLTIAVKQESALEQEKFDCYFGYTKRLCHRYILLLKENILVVTAIKINIPWQKIAERKSTKR